MTGRKITLSLIVARNSGRGTEKKLDWHLFGRINMNTTIVQYIEW
jgi:hypothetical protein